MIKLVPIIYSHRTTASLLITFLVLAVLIPQSALARSSVTCDLYQRIDGKDISLSKDAIIIGKEGDTIVVVWKSSGATKATDQKRRDVAINGSTTVVVRDSSQDIAYTFRDRSKRVTCSATIVSLSAGINERSLKKVKTHPVVSGTASGVRSVRVVVIKDSAVNASYDRTIRVTQGKWKTSSIRGLSSGTYDVRVYTVGDTTSPTLLDSASFRYGRGESSSSSRNSSSSNKIDSAISVSAIPLLAGGSVGAGQTIPVSYLQIRNDGDKSVTVSSIELRQTGTLGAANVSALSIVDDQGIERGRTSNSGTPFRDMTGSVPVSLPLTPGEMRLLTVKATLGANVVPGLVLNLVISNVTTNGSLRASFPIPGAMWTTVR